MLDSRRLAFGRLVMALLLTAGLLAPGLASPGTPPVNKHLEPADIIAALADAHAALHGPAGVDPAGAARARSALAKLAVRLSADPTTLNRSVRQRTEGIVGLLDANKLKEAEDALHALFVSLSKPPPLSSKTLRPALVEIDMFLHTTRPDGARRCQAVLRDYLDVISLDQTLFATWATRRLGYVLLELDAGRIAVADAYMHLLLTQLEQRDKIGLRAD